MFGVYIDSKKSGTSERGRPEFNEAMKRATKEGAMLVAFDLSRVARSTRDTFNIIERLQAGGAGFTTVQESWLNTATPEGRVMLTFMAAMNQYFSELHSKKTKDGLRYRRRNSLSTGGTPPYGSFHSEPDARGTRQVLKDPGCQRVIEWICWRRHNGFSFGSMVMELQMRGVPYYANRKQGPPTKGIPWRYAALQKICNREYKQRVEDGKTFDPVALDAFDHYANRAIAKRRYPLTWMPDLRPPIVIHRALVPDLHGIWPHQATLDPLLVGLRDQAARGGRTGLHDNGARQGPRVARANHAAHLGRHPRPAPRPSPRGDRERAG